MGCPTGGSAKPATGETFAPCAGQRRPAVRVGVETGLWRVVLRMRGGCLAQCQPPWRSRIINARPNPCRTMPPVAQGCPCPGGEQAARNCLSDADTIRRYSGPRADCATPRMSPPRRRHAHQTHFRTAQPARGPPDLHFLIPVVLHHTGVPPLQGAKTVKAVSICRTLSDQNGIFYEQSRRPILVTRRKTRLTSLHMYRRCSSRAQKTFTSATLVSCTSSLPRSTSCSWLDVIVRPHRARNVKVHVSILLLLVVVRGFAL